MIYFKTLYFDCKAEEAHRIEDVLGMPRYLTVNGEAPVVMGDKGWQILKGLERTKKVQIRNKITITGFMSKGFEMAIGNFLKKEADGDPLFRAKMEAHPEKDAKAVCSYILAEVAKQVGDTGAGGYDDAEVFSMAKHFIDEDELKPENFKGRVTVVTNHHVELSSKEKEDAKAVAIEEYKMQVKKQEKAAAEERAKKAAERAKAAAERKKQEAVEKAKKLERLQPSLFGDF